MMTRTPRFARHGAALACLALAVGLAAMSGSSPHVADVRLGAHPDFDRIVIEVEDAVPVLATAGADDSLVVLIGATPLLPSRTIVASLPRVGAVSIEAVESGTEVRVMAAGSRVRAFLLERPFRVVLDFADPGPGPFAIPGGAAPVIWSDEQLEGPEEPTVAAAPPAPEEIVAAPDTPPAAEEMSAEASLESAVVAEPGAALQAAIPAPNTTPPVDPVPGVAAAAPQLAPSGLAALILIPLAIAVAIGAALLVAHRRRGPARARPARRPVARAPESIAPDEIARASDRVDILEKRIDEEVRARMKLEERVVSLREDVAALGTGTRTRRPRRFSTRPFRGLEH